MLLNKNEARKIFSQKRKNISVDYKKSSEKLIAEKLINSQLLNRFETVLCYVSVKNEVDTSFLIDYLIQNNKKVFVPNCAEEEMVFLRLKGIDELVEGRFGIPTADSDKSEKLSASENILCIVPGLAFDKLGNRLGYGGGYYDRFFAKNPGIFKVALSFDCCLCDTIPHECFDLPVDVIITENKIIGKL